jgi:hypothetical protein
MTFKQTLLNLGACEDAVMWVGDKTLQESWDTCHRGDWMLWLYSRIRPENLKELTLAKGHVANTVRHLMKDQRSLDAVDVAIRFGEGLATKDELDAAAKAANAAAYAAYASADAAAYAPAYAAYAATDDANATGTANAAAKAAGAAGASLKESADICRKYLIL